MYQRNLISNSCRYKQICQVKGTMQPVQISRRTNSALQLLKYTQKNEANLRHQSVINNESLQSYQGFHPSILNSRDRNNNSKVYIGGKCLTPQKSANYEINLMSNNSCRGQKMKQVQNIKISNSLYVLNKCLNACRQVFKLSGRISLNFESLNVSSNGTISPLQHINQHKSGPFFQRQKQLVSYLFESVKKISDHSFTDFYTYYIRSSNRIKLDLKAAISLIKSYKDCSKIQIACSINDKQQLKTIIIAKSTRTKDGSSNRLFPNPKQSIHRNRYSARLFYNEDRIKTEIGSRKSINSSISLQKCNTINQSENHSVSMGVSQSVSMGVSQSVSKSASKNMNRSVKRISHAQKIQHQFAITLNQTSTPALDEHTALDECSISNDNTNIAKKSCCTSAHTKDSNVSSSNILSSRMDSTSCLKQSNWQSEWGAVSFSNKNFNAFTPHKPSQQPTSTRKGLMNFSSVLNNNDLQQVLSQQSSQSENSILDYEINSFIQCPRLDRLSRNIQYQQLQQKLTNQIKQNQQRIIGQNKWTRKIDTLMSVQSQLKQSYMDSDCFDDEQQYMMDDDNNMEYMLKHRNNRLWRQQTVKSQIHESTQLDKKVRTQQRRYTQNIQNITVQNLKGL